MRDALKSYLALASGVTEVTRQRALEAAKALVSQGEAAAEQVTSLTEDLLAQTRQNREAVAALVSYEVDRALGRVGLATADEVETLTARVRTLEAQLAQAKGGSSGGSSNAPAKKAAKKAAKAPAEVPAKAPAPAAAKAAAKAAGKAPAAAKAPAGAAGGAAGTKKAASTGAAKTAGGKPAKKATGAKAGA